MTVDEDTQPAVWPPERKCPLTMPEEYSRARKSDGLSRATLWNGVTTWLAAKYDDVTAILTDRRFSADPSKPNYPAYSMIRAETLQAHHFALAFIDPPLHTDLRRIFAPLFTVRRMDSLRPRLTDVVRRLLREFISGDPPRDFLTNVASRIPVWAVVEIMGLPHSDERLFRQWATANFFHTRDPEGAIQAVKSMQDYIEAALAETEASGHGGDGIISRLVTDQIMPGHLTRHEAALLLANLVLNAQDTSANMVALGTLALLENPSQIDVLTSTPQLVPNAVDELLRYLTIAQFNVARTALEDVEIGGTHISRGDPVIASVVAANHDPQMFSDPASLDIQRQNAARHVGFGHGIHSCIGRPLAKLELEVVFGMLFQEIPTLRLAVDLSEVESTGNRSQAYGVMSLPVEW